MAAKRQMEREDSDDVTAAPPPSKRKCVSGDTLKRARFAEPTSYVELRETAGTKPKKVIPRNTQKNDGWALRVFEEWISERNERCDDEKCPEDVLETEDANCLSKWLSLFTIEARKKDGSKYPPGTLHMLLCGLQRIMRRRNSHPFDIFSKKDARFRGFQSTMELVFQNLHKEGIGTETKCAEAISAEEEAALWEKGIIGASSPLALVRAIFYLNGKNFCLKGGQKHRQLKLSQFQREKDHWKYTEHKSRGGSVGDVRVVRQFPCPSAGNRCHVHLLDLYFSKLPREAKEKDAAFYFTELKHTPEDPLKPWFTAVPMGWNKLDRMVKSMFQDAGIDGKSNHSLYVTTRKCGNIIQSGPQTGHKSNEALRGVCKQPCVEKDQACEALLADAYMVLIVT